MFLIKVYGLRRLKMKAEDVKIVNKQGNKDYYHLNEPNIY